MIDKIKVVFKSYFYYFIFMFSVTFCTTYFYLYPWIFSIVELDENNLYILFKKENINIKDSNVQDYIKQKITIYENNLEEQKVRIDKEREYKKRLVSQNLTYENNKDICTTLKIFIQNSAILQKYELSKEYSLIQKKEFSSCSKTN